MGRWSQARKRGGGNVLPPPLPAPGAIEWNLVAGGEGLALATFVSDPPDGVDSWQCRWYVEAFTDWTLGVVAGLGIEFEFDALGFLHVQVRYVNSDTGVFSDWSAEKEVENT